MKRKVKKIISILLTILTLTNINLISYASINEQYGQGEDWEIALEVSRLPLNSLAKNENNVVVAVGSNGLIKTSNDGNSWRITNGNSDNLYKVKCINNNFFVVGDNGTLLSSTDGYNWSKIYTGVRTNLKDINFYNSTYYLVGDSGTFLSSTDKKNWISNYTGINENIIEMQVFKDELFIISEQGFYKSRDFINFQKLRGEEIFRNGDIYLSSLQVGKNKLVLEYKKYIQGISYVFIESSYDGNTWSEKKLDDSFDSKVIWNGEKFLLYSWNGVYTSVDGVNWGFDYVNSNYNKPNDLIYYKDEMIAVSSNQNGISDIAKSKDGITFEEVPEVVSAQRYNDIVWGNGNFIVVGNKGNILQSFDGVKWNKLDEEFGSILSVDYGPMGYVASSVLGKIYFSKNGDVWTLANVPELPDNTTWINYIKWVSDRYISVSEYGEVLSSRDGLNWQQVYKMNNIDNRRFSIQDIVRDNKNTIIYNYDYESRKTIIIKTSDYNNWDIYEYDNLIKGVIYVDGKYYGMGERAIMTSSDGVEWVEVKRFKFSLYSPQKILWTGREFFIANNFCTITSIDGVNWDVIEVKNSSIGGTSTAYNGNKYVSVGSGRNMYGSTNIISSKTIKNDSIPSRLEIIGEQYFNIGSTDRFIQFNSRLIDENGMEISNYKLNWKVEKNDLGIQIDSSGKLLIPKDCKKGKVLITAELDNSNNIMVGKNIYIGEKTSIDFKSKEIKFKVGDTLNLYDLVNLNNVGLEEVAISSSDLRIVTANDRYDIIANKVGRATITLTNLKDGMDVDLKVIVLGKEDINEDGSVDILDLGSLALKYNKKIEDFSTEDKATFSKYDLNKDNIIDIYDLVLISNKILLLN